MNVRQNQMTATKIEKNALTLTALTNAYALKGTLTTEMLAGKVSLHTVLCKIYLCKAQTLISNCESCREV